MKKPLRNLIRKITWEITAKELISYNNNQAFVSLANY